jgi:uncharacterized protein YhbP (UPF0306 family)
MTASELPAEVAAYLASHHVMTLATQGADGPWAAAVFYAWHEGSLIFISAPSTRHALNLAADPRCAATIHDDTGDWKAVKGIQFEGRVEQLAGKHADQARLAYGNKFPLVSPLTKIPPPIAEALAKIRWYRLRPQRMYYIDNAKGFGHREQLDLDQ